TDPEKGGVKRGGPRAVGQGVGKLAVQPVVFRESVLEFGDDVRPVVDRDDLAPQQIVDRRDLFFADHRPVALPGPRDRRGAAEERDAIARAHSRTSRSRRRTSPPVLSSCRAKKAWARKYPSRVPAS